MKKAIIMMVVVVVIFLFTGCTNISGEAVRGGRGVPEKIAAPDNQQEEPKQVEIKEHSYTEDLILMIK